MLEAAYEREGDTCLLGDVVGKSKLMIVYGLGRGGVRVFVVGSETWEFDDRAFRLDVDA